MMRRADWMARLQATICARHAVPFAYGQHDCIVAAAAAVEAMTDVDLIADIRGHYHSAASAMRLVRTLGFDAVADILSARMEAVACQSIDIHEAHVGDICLTDQAVHDACAGAAAGICVGRYILYPGPIGWTSLPRSSAFHAFSIGS